jgi:Uri superfamily endonuclease
VHSPGDDNGVTQRRAPQRLALGVECHLSLKIQRQIALKFTRLGKPRHWHIDSLREVAQLVSFAVHVGSERIECAAAGRVGALPGAHQPIARFGASDCRCSAHLTFFSERPDLQLDPTWTVVPLDAPD